MTKYWYNTKTREVEQGHRSSWEHLMGPYDTEAEARHALEIAKARNERWDSDDEDWERGD
ncbi:hypothetical protein [Demequina pelophila]|uniref:hypothetical protein n=1 Tax=Demequina pelophila TaxID=1638984 RepID=UPI0007861078|nr:hypothetical protein [Demequina pelophila]